jgi:hypothetical protein
MLAVEQDNGKIIAASNSFLTDHWWTTTQHVERTQQYEQQHGIYKGMFDTYNTILQQSTDPVIVPYYVEKEVVMFSNSFTGTNSGHDLGTLLATLLYVQKNIQDPNSIVAAVQELGFKFPRIIEILELFYPRDTWQLLDFDTLYKFTKAHFVVVDPLFVIQRYKDDDVKDLISNISSLSDFYLVSQGLAAPSNAKVILLKQAQNTSVRTHDAFSGAQFLAKMTIDDGWVVLNPEFDDMRYMISLLHNAADILVSYGAIMWTHMLFFNPEARVTHLQIGDEVAYAPVKDMKYFTRIIVTDTNLDSEANKNLISQIQSLHS